MRTFVMRYSILFITLAVAACATEALSKPSS